MGSEPENKPKTLLEKVDHWLHSQGYPLEFATAHALREAGFARARQGEHIRDQKTGALREVDVYAAIEGKSGRRQKMRLALVVECKSNQSHPWVAFRRKGGLSPLDSMLSLIGTQHMRARIASHRKNPKVLKLGLFRTPDATAFAGVEAFKPREARDNFYAALQSVVSVSALIAKWHEEHELWGAFWPVIVCGGPLVAASYRPSDGAMELVEVDAIRVDWRGAEAAEVTSTIDVVRSTYLPEWARVRYREFGTLRDLLATDYNARS